MLRRSEGSLVELEMMVRLSCVERLLSRMVFDLKVGDMQPLSA